MIELIGHRGYPALYPENTLLSFSEALNIGCNGIELDIRLTKDKKVVVIHDETLDRTTNGTGLIGNYFLKDLKKIDAGNGEIIPTLKDVLGKLKGIKFLVEIKVSTSDTRGKIEKLCEETTDLVGTKKNIFLISFNLQALEIIKGINQKLRTGLIFSKPLISPERFLKFTDILCPRKDILDSKTMKVAAGNDLGVYVWTVDTEEEFKRVTRYNVTGIVSNNPGIVVKLL